MTPQPYEIPSLWVLATQRMNRLSERGPKFLNVDESMNHVIAQLVVPVGLGSSRLPRAEEGIEGIIFGIRDWRFAGIGTDGGRLNLGPVSDIQRGLEAMWNRTCSYGIHPGGGRSCNAFAARQYCEYFSCLVHRCGPNVGCRYQNYQEGGGG